MTSSVTWTRSDGVTKSWPASRMSWRRDLSECRSRLQPLLDRLRDLVQHYVDNLRTMMWNCFAPKPG